MDERSQLYGAEPEGPRLERRVARLPVTLRRFIGIRDGVLVSAGVLSESMLRRDTSLCSLIVDNEVGILEFFADGPTNRCGVLAGTGVMSAEGRLRVAGVSFPNTVVGGFGAAGARDVDVGSPDA